MKRLLFYTSLFLLSFFGTATYLLSLDTVQMQLVEKGALALEKVLDSHLYFQRTPGLSCANILIRGKYNLSVEKIAFSIDPMALLYGSLSVNSIDFVGIEGVYDFHGKAFFNFEETFTLSGTLQDIPFYGKCAIDFSEGEFEVPTWNGTVTFKGSSIFAKCEQDGVLVEGALSLSLEELRSESLRLKWKEFDETLQLVYKIHEQVVQGEGKNVHFLADIDNRFLCAQLYHAGGQAELHLREGEGQIHGVFEEYRFDWKWVEGKATPFKVSSPQGIVHGVASLLEDRIQFDLNKIDGVPFALQKGGTGYLLLNKDLPLVLDATFEGELSPLLKPYMADTTLATGMFEAKVQVRDRVVTGTVSVEQGSYESLVLGCSFQEIRGTFHFENGTLFCDSLRGRDAAGGTITASGSLDKEGFAFDFDLNNIHLLHLDFANAFATGKMAFIGNGEAAAFKGKLELKRFDIRLPDTTPARLQALEVEYVNQSDDESPPTFFESTKPWPIALDIELKFPRHAFVFGTQFSSEWSGAVLLRGTLDEPLLFGETKILSASFLFNGKHFASNEGTVRFNGPVGRKTTLYLIAKHDLEDTEIDVILKGPLREPELAFRSNPPKSNREILSLILFNKPTGDMNVEESQELTRNIIKLSDQLSSGPTLLDRLKSSFGIDRIDITANDLDESVRVGKYLTNRLFLSLKKSMDDKPNQASIEAKLTQNIKAQGEVGDDAEARLMLKWEKDY